jgi:hypothetical protein
VRSYIRLELGNLEVDWGKNHSFVDHSPLFQRSDVQFVQYEYVNEEGEAVFEEKEAFRKLLRQVLPRLELLGYTVESARREYEQLQALNGGRVDISFDEVASALRLAGVTSVSRYYSGEYDFGELFSEEIYDRIGLDEISRGKKPWRDDLGEVMENFHSWYVLRLLAESPRNLDLHVTWYISDVLDGGWIDRSDVVHELPASQRFLIVTEGSSDAKIIRKALHLLRPEIEDFFYFVDMEEGYPFTGTGNLHRFCQGLVSIGILNQVLVVYDNDTEGTSKCMATRSLSLPSNMRVVQLPELLDFTRFPTIGPNGPATEDINGRAASIECYLDLTHGDDGRRVVRWTSYNSDLDRYQGEVIDKNYWVRSFLSLRLADPTYDFTRLTAVLKHLVSECQKIAANTQ